MKYYNRVDEKYEVIERPKYFIALGSKQGVESELIEFEVKYTFDMDLLEVETIEEARDYFYQDLRKDLDIQVWFFRTYLTYADLNKDKIYEELME